MNEQELKAIINGLIALCQREDILPTDSDNLADEVQRLAEDEMYIPKTAILDYLVE